MYSRRKNNIFRSNVSLRKIIGHSYVFFNPKIFSQPGAPDIQTDNQHPASQKSKSQSQIDADETFPFATDSRGHQNALFIILSGKKTQIASHAAKGLFHDSILPFLHPHAFFGIRNNPYYGKLRVLYLDSREENATEQDDSRCHYARQKQTSGINHHAARSDGSICSQRRVYHSCLIHGSCQGYGCLFAPLE